MCVCAHLTGTLSCKGVRVAMLRMTNCEIAERERGLLRLRLLVET